MRRIFFFLLTCISLTCLASTNEIQAQLITDSKAFNWDFAQNASIEDGSNDTFDGGMLLFVGSDSFDGNGASEREGNLYVFGPEDVGGVVVSRSVLLVDEPAGLFYAESFRNKGGSKIRINPRVVSDFGDEEQPQTELNGEGKMVAMRYPHPSPRAAVVYLFGDAASSYLPSLRGSGDVYTFEYPQLTLQPGQRKTIGYFVAQRDLEKTETLYKNDSVFQDCVNAISSLKSFSFVNLPGMSLYDTGDLDLHRQDTSDFIKTRGGDEVFGSLETKEFELVTDIGTRSFKADEMINLFNSGNDEYRVIISDGSILRGELKPERISFRLSDGIAGEISTKDIERIVTKDVRPPQKGRQFGEWFEFSKPLVVFANGDRLTGTIANDSFAVSTALGKFDVPVAALASVQFDQSSSGGMTSLFTTRDGQRFSGVFYDDVELEFWKGSKLEVAAGNLLAMHLTDPSKNGNKRTRHDSFLKIGKRDFIYANILAGQRPLEFETAFGRRKIDPEQILSLVNIRGLVSEMQITLWDQSKLKGKLVGKSILFEVLGSEVEIAATLITRFDNPLASPPETQKERYLETIEKLSHKKFKIRDAAMKSLQKDAGKIRGLLLSQLEGADLQTKAQIWKLLPEEDRRRLKKLVPEKQTRIRIGKEAGEVGGNAEPLDENDESISDPNADHGEPVDCAATGFRLPVIFAV
jgi:hypothetical protein